MKSHTGFRWFLCLLSLALLLPHCQKKDETPPPPKVLAPSVESSTPDPSSPPSASRAASQSSPDCYDITPVAGLKEGMGRIVVAYPGDPKGLAARLDIYEPGDSRSINGGYGSREIELPPGTYDIGINGRRLGGVTVKAGHDTRINVGVLHVYAGKQTRIDLLDPSSGKVLTGGYGEQSYGFPVGPVSVQVAGQSETVPIEKDKVTEF